MRIERLHLVETDRGMRYPASPSYFQSLYIVAVVEGEFNMSETADNTGVDADYGAGGSGDTGNSAPAWLVPALLLASVVIGVCAVQFVGSMQRFFYPPPHGQLGDPPWWLDLVRVAMMKNDAIAFGVMGAILVGAIGLLCGAANNAKSLILGAIVGAVVGAIAGATSAPIGYYIQDKTQQIDMDGALKTAEIWILPFLSIGIAGGLIGSLFGPWRGAALLGIGCGIGTALAMLAAYIVTAIVAFPMGYPEKIFAEDTGIQYAALICWALAGGAAPVLTHLRSKKN
ncbi:MAG: hypothetical protein Aurels2KO_26260 [Aureliella sp.]